MRPSVSIRCVGITKAFGEVRVLEELTIGFLEGVVSALIGPNGAGKTTLLNVISGLISPDSGSVLFRDSRIEQLAPFRVARRGIARSFQELRLIRELPALDNVLLGMPGERTEHLAGAMQRLMWWKRDRHAIDRAMGYLEYVGLSGASQRQAGELSFGQQKLLSIACCLALEARVLLLDEPLSGVHPSRAEEIGSVIQRLGSEGLTVVFVEHDMEFVRTLASHAVVLNEGRVVGEGQPEEVLLRPAIVEAYVGTVAASRA